MKAEEQNNFIKTGVGVSSKNFKKAVQRNRIKRLLREAFRTEKQPLYICAQNSTQKLAVFLLYVDKIMPEFALVKEKMKLVIERLLKELNEAVV